MDLHFSKTVDRRGQWASGNQQQTSLVPFQFVVITVHHFGHCLPHPTTAAGRCYERRPPLLPLVVPKCRSWALKTPSNALATPGTRRPRWRREFDWSRRVFVIAATSTSTCSVLESLPTAPWYVGSSFTFSKECGREEETRFAWRGFDIHSPMSISFFLLTLRSYSLSSSSHGIDVVLLNHSTTTPTATSREYARSPCPFSLAFGI
jgi:hypothetical protein